MASAMETGGTRRDGMGRVLAGGGVSIRSGYEPGIVGRVGELHGRYYATAWGAGAPFEILATRDMCAFIEGYDPERDLMLGAYSEGRMVGSIAILGRKPGPDGVQLRFFIVDPAWHGHGVGKALLHAALAWCRERGYGKVFLWTVDGLPASRRLYEKAGFRIVAREPDDRYTVLRDNLKMELDLSAAGH
ncbi:GCN5-related N-acetyltransferase [Solidesulfovibrio fructosivorans JJ]]|uniref:GCN5-related N-acetyltransferase n=1 Tax=Solidesulfovibrio fructosivorans JJ] TaxID=596151 RepID=E1JVY3_SOLFR|nr:GNAT family N-acetyltransferase [Solidesulfovibrio fructosivorans]EFL51621.1 GCN5-related N-acetyltransferase [Solidesulfovibrio fructosivorans JJ]]